MLETFTVETFSPHVGDSFQLLIEGVDPIEMQLISASEAGPVTKATAKQGGRVPFALLFRNPQRHRYLPQRIYHLEHKQLGAMDIFLVPIGPDAEGMQYEAVFS